MKEDLIGRHVPPGTRFAFSLTVELSWHRLCSKSSMPRLCWCHRTDQYRGGHYGFNQVSVATSFAVPTTLFPCGIVVKNRLSRQSALLMYFTLVLAAWSPDSIDIKPSNITLVLKGQVPQSAPLGSRKSQSNRPGVL